MAEAKEDRRRLVRLNVNLNIPTADALREVCERQGISYTEGLRRAISVAAYIHEEEKADRVIRSVRYRKNGTYTNIKELVLL